MINHNKYMLSIEDFNASEFIKVGSNDNIYVYKDLPLDTPICRYIPIDYLIEMLETQKLYVANRHSLNDKREQGIKEDLRAIFPISPTFGKKLRKTKVEADKISQKHKLAYSICVSCWTKHIEESIMFWNCYGNTLCRISTTIENLIDSIKTTDKTIIIAPINYTNNERMESVYSKIFWKYSAYEDEQEIRLCVLANDHHIYLDVNTDILINGILFNPFWGKSYQLFLKTSMVQKFPIFENMIKFSHLLEN